MPRTRISEYSSNPALNTDIDGINIAEGMAPSDVNNAIRELMSQLKDFQTGASADAFTFAGGVLISGSPNTVSGSLVVSGNINSSGTTNTFSGGNILSGTNTISGSAIISGNINSSGSNTFSGAQVISGNINSSGTNTFSGATVISNTLSGVTQLNVDNLRLDGNTISSTDTNGNIVLAPNGTGDVVPGTDDTYDLGSSSAEWKDLYIDGTANIDSLVADTADINAGTIDGVTIGGASAAAGTFTTATVGAGTVSAPAITTTGDDNTGIFFPAADTIAFAEGGAEAMRIDSSGNVGIGTTSPTTLLSLTKDNVSARGQLTINGGNSGISQITLYKGATTTTDLVAQIYSTANNNTLNLAAYPSDGVISFQTGTSNTERMRIDSSGNVGIGTTSPARFVDISKSSDSGNSASFPVLRVQNSLSTQGNYSSTYNFARIDIQAGGTTVFGAVGARYDTTFSGMYIGPESSHPVLFQTNGSERMRITSGGEVYIAGTTDQGAYNLQCNGTGVWGAGAYVNGSDARIKEDVTPIDSGLDVVEKLNPVTYRYKEDWSKDQSVQTGFIAQELLTALDGKNYVDGIVQQGGAEGYYSVAYQNIIPILTKAIQELKAELDEAKARIAALEAK